MIDWNAIVAGQREAWVLGATAALGLAFGVLAQGSRFCFLRALQAAFARTQPGPLRLFAVAMATALVGSQWLAGAADVNLGQSLYAQSRLSLVALLLGGLLFGYGMALANACGARSLVLLGSGNLRSLVTLLCLAVGAAATLSGVLAPLRIRLTEATQTELPAATLPALIAWLLPLSQPVPAAAWRWACVVLLLAALLGWALTRRSVPTSTTATAAAPLSAPASPARALLPGVLIGLLVPLGWWITGRLGADDFEPLPLGSLTFVAPVAQSLQYLQLSTGIGASTGAVLCAGVLVGALASALVRREFQWQGFTTAAQTGRSIVGGTLMGVGGVLALGCSIGQGLTGFSTLALSTYPALAGIVGGAWLAWRTSAREGQ
ncbi:YeeE/YedE family protein [Acidovorax sp.]|uniref:YeeE/YedE family protein n=1 Tax=Acidovorax sp. TaxID=1872122 RepID=UPI0039196552